jgi:hypothetical protein
MDELFSTDACSEKMQWSFGDGLPANEYTGFRLIKIGPSSGLLFDSIKSDNLSQFDVILTVVYLILGHSTFGPSPSSRV